MDGKRLELLIRALRSGAARRAVLRGIGGAAVGALALGQGLDVAAARCKARQAACRKKSQCCGSKKKHVRCLEGADGTPGTKVCCGVANASCGSLADCCTGFDCIGETESEPGTCQAVG